MKYKVTFCDAKMGILADRVVVAPTITAMLHHILYHSDELIPTEAIHIFTSDVEPD